MIVTPYSDGRKILYLFDNYKQINKEWRNLSVVEEVVFSPYSGTVETVLTEESNHVYEWERLFLIKTKSGKIEEISIGISGYITSLPVKKGQVVNTHTVLATIQDDMLITGSD
jgi:biotin carboxyl carrier protein